MARQRSRAKPGWVKALAQKNMEKLLSLAEGERSNNPARSRRYATLAKQTAEKYGVKLPRAYKKRICPECGTILVPGKSLKVRTSAKTRQTLYICQECGHIQKMGYSREKLKKDKIA